MFIFVDHFLIFAKFIVKLFTATADLNYFNFVVIVIRIIVVIREIITIPERGSAVRLMKNYF